MGDEKEYSAELWAAMMLNIGDEALWKEYKSGFSAAEWPEAREKVFSAIRTGHYRAFSWYALEKRYDLIMEGIESGGYTDALKQYEKKLKELYPERCLEVLAHSTVKMAEHIWKDI